MFWWEQRPWVVNPSEWPSCLLEFKEIVIPSTAALAAAPENGLFRSNLARYPNSKAVSGSLDLMAREVCS